jgi:hypothetical protein
MLEKLRRTMQISDNLQVNIQTWGLPNAKKEHSNTQYSTTISHLFTKNTVKLRNAYNKLVRDRK